MHSEMIQIFPALCTACRACVIACHFHHTRLFGTAQSSIHIRYDGDTADLTIEFDGTCDLCIGEKYRLCVKACVPNALQVVNGSAADKQGGA